MGENLQRLDQIAKPDAFDDQKPAASIATSEIDSTDYSDFQEFIISQFKRIIHGNQPGNWHDDPASVHGGDASLWALFQDFHEIVQHDLLDNNSEYIVIGNKTIDKKIDMSYSFELPIADKSLVGLFTFSHDGANVNLRNRYSFVGPEITGIAFSASIVGDEIRLNIVTNGIGENPTIKYRRTSMTV